MKYLKIGVAFVLLVNFIPVQSISAYPVQGHVVSIQEVQKQVYSQSTQRISNIQDIQKLLRHTEVQKHFNGLYDLQKIEVALANLDDKTLEDLASRSRLANDQLQAGLGTGGIIAIAVVVTVIIIIIVAVVPKFGG